MSSIYIQEPSTLGKVLLKTTFGDIDIELWAREAPKACRNFVQLCMEGFYSGTIFHRVERGFIAQGGDPTGTGTCNESIYGAPFKDEIHSRLRFVRRGLVACANAGKDDNGSQFFFTFASTPELQGKHTIFGKVAGDTIYNLPKLEEAMVDRDNRPIYEQKIIKAIVLNNPFDDIEPRTTPKDKVKEKADSKKEKKREPGVKNFKLLSFGDEAEEDEIETTIENKRFEGKSKSTHDVLNDPKLSSKTISDKEKGNASDSDDDGEGSSRNIDTLKQLEDVRNKLKSGKAKEKEKPKPKPNEESSDEGFMSSTKKEKKKKLEEIRNEMKTLRREYRQEKKQKLEKEETEKKEKHDKSEVLVTYEKDQEKYLPLKRKAQPKGDSRQDLTLKLLGKFSEKLHTVKSHEPKEDEETKTNDDEEASDEWIVHSLKCDSNEVLAKDANTKADDWFDIYDPRNPLNKRRRETSKQQLKEKGRPKHNI